MHTAMVIGGGLILLAAMIVVARLFGISARSAALAFIPLWFICAVINLWIGVTEAGYTVMQELPILAVVFGVPALLAYLLSRRQLV